MTDIVGPSSSVGSVITRPSDGRQWGPNDTWFVDCSTPLSDDGTDIPAAWLNQVTGFFRNVIRANGLKRDGVNPVVPIDQSDNMVLNALQQMAQRGQGNFAVDTGSSDALLAAPAVTPAEYKAGMRFYVWKNPNVGANVTITPAIDFGLGALTITKCDASTLGIGDLRKGGFFEVEIDGLGNARLLSLTTLSDVSVTYAKGSLIARRVFTASNTYTPTAGTNRVRVYCTGGGGAGGATQATTSQQWAAGAGGAGGATEVGDFSAGFSGVYMTIGAGGLSSSTSGGPGGTSSFGSLLSAPGGGGGSLGAAVSTPAVQAGGQIGIGSGGNVSHCVGGAGGLSVSFNAGNLASGFGGGSFWGFGAPAVFTSSNIGLAGYSPGTGGSGAVAQSSAGAQLGGVGAPGIIIVEEYA